MVESAQAMQILIDLTRRLSTEEPLEASLQAVTDAALALLPANHASVRLFDDSGTVLLSGARSGQGVNHRPVTFRPGEGVVGWVAEHGERVRLEEVHQDPRYATKTGQGFTIRALVAVPLWSGGRVVGVLSATADVPAAFTEGDEMVAQLIANCAVASVEKTRLKHLAVTDHQTRAYNQRYLIPRLREEMDRGRVAGSPLAVLLLDLDHFKRVNDQYGHAAGDAVLRAFTDRLRAVVRTHDVLVRRGGDEFVLVMPRTDAAQALRIGERIRRETGRRLFRLEGVPPLHVTVTIGVALWDGREGPESLEARADAAMYEGKREGRDRVAVAGPASEGGGSGTADI